MHLYLVDSSVRVKWYTAINRLIKSVNSFFIFNIAICKVYSNSLLNSLNSRGGWKYGNNAVQMQGRNTEGSMGTVVGDTPPQYKPASWKVDVEQGIPRTPPKVSWSWIPRCQSWLHKIPHRIAQEPSVQMSPHPNRKFSFMSNHTRRWIASLQATTGFIEVCINEQGIWDCAGCFCQVNLLGDANREDVYLFALLMISVIIVDSSPWVVVHVSSDLRTCCTVMHIFI